MQAVCLYLVNVFRFLLNPPIKPRFRFYISYRALTLLCLSCGGNPVAVERALISVFDKTAIVEFAKRLAALRIEILSTGGTAKLLREAGVAVRDVSDFTGWPEMLGGRVKTLHPKLHVGLLLCPNHPADQKQAQEQGIAPIDLVGGNLYPF